ncbi:MAG: HU family DNA-binding protein [Tabrizicola flagellatus]|uniref:HU family DNA-binding protein n=1 Tax=Tabrizicola flagellatus TaxID=2593021 RepID=UPI00391B3BB1
MTVSKGRLIDDLAESQGMTKAAAGACVEAILNLIRGAAAAGDKVIIQGFGTFEMKTRAARTGRNPQTGLPVEIPATTTLTFKAAKPKA